MGAMTERPSLTERRRGETRLEIATIAAGLFAEHGAEATTAEEIARTAGVALRTFYRYFRTKEEAVTPLLAAGGRRWVELIAQSPADLPVPQVLERAAVDALTPQDDEGAHALLWTRALLNDPALRTVWQAVQQDSEDQLVAVLTARGGPRADQLEVRLAAAAATAAIRVALEIWADGDAPETGPDSPGDLAARCVRELTAGLRLWDGDNATSG